MSSKPELCCETEEFWKVPNYQVKELQRFIDYVTRSLRKLPIIHLLP